VAAVTELTRADELRAFGEVVAGCTKCALAGGRTQVVFGSGNPDSDLMFVGEAPGFHEDKQGVPFVGAAGKLLDQLLADIGLARDDVYVVNVLKCRPPGNRDPLPDEIEACEGHLWRQIELIEPRVVATLGNFTTKLLTNTPLGQDTVPDFLGVSFSATDHVGHAYGPFTPELDDTFLQTDRQLGAFMQSLDARVGAGNWTMALLADHGVSEVPEKVKARGGDAGRINAVAFRAALGKDLTIRVGPDADRLFEAVEAPELYLDYAEAGRRGIDAPTLERAVKEVALKQPGIARAYTRNEIMSAAPNSDPMLRAVAEGFNAGRSGDIYLIVKPNWIFWTATGTTHGTPYEYDQHVPLIFYGAGISKATHNERVTISDLAPTLAVLADVQMPQLPGRVLANALAPRR
jgi:uracil-DNA glycosylase family 4